MNRGEWAGFDDDMPADPDGHAFTIGVIVEADEHRVILLVPYDDEEEWRSLPLEKVTEYPVTDPIDHFEILTPDEVRAFPARALEEWGPPS
jgi:hypothetical protein